jgi:hypothetical protein
MRKFFPETFEGEEEEPVRSVAKRSVVAATTRTTAAKKITLSKTQFNIATQLGLTPLQYAEAVEELKRTK